ncbi:helix-turn-helix domain-containing protein [Sphingobacterium sp. LRF_L2]|uniref:helix-turn-helix domain-containing protein n=1 Tax=Sphingobacterium sp. LRF_L2 TaxID=3369421 RepID=UPI003F629B56
MIQTIRNTDFEYFSASKKEHAIEVKDKNWIDSLFAIPTGKIYFAEQRLNNDLSIVQGSYNLDEHTSIDGVGEGALLEIQFNLSQHDIHYNNYLGNDQISPAQSGNIVYLSGTDNAAKIHFEKKISYNTFDIHLPIHLLDAYAGESKLMDTFIESIQGDYSSMLTPRRMPIDPKIVNTIADIKACPYEGLSRKIYLESKVYEIIAYLMHNGEKKASTVKLGKDDRDRIHYAAHLLREQLDLPMTIIELSRHVGVNQTKLKSGFREMFGTSVFGYLQEIKMHHAKQALLDTDISIQEIGYKLGYQNTSNFSIAFKKFHGCSPIKMRGR